jgi:hypothetical protein
MKIDLARSTVSVMFDDAVSLADVPVALNEQATAMLLVNIGQNNDGAGECRVEYDDVTFDTTN